MIVRISHPLRGYVRKAQNLNGEDILWNIRQILSSPANVWTFFR